MSAYASRFEEMLKAHLIDEIERESEILVNNRTLTDREVEFKRGEISRMRSILNITIKEVSQKINEE